MQVEYWTGEQSSNSNSMMAPLILLLAATATTLHQAQAAAPLEPSQRNQFLKNKMLRSGVIGRILHYRIECF